MDDQRVMALLRRFETGRKKDAEGSVICEYKTCGFYDAYVETECNKDTYEDEMKELQRRELIDIDVNGGRGFKMAKVLVTRNGARWIAEHED